MKRLLTVSVLVLGLGALAAFTIYSGGIGGVFDSKEREAYSLVRYRDKPDLAGGVMVVVKDGRAALVKGWGSANLENQIPNSPASVFDMGSMSKQFTAFAFAKLVTEGRLSPDDDVRDYIPELPEWEQTVRLSHLVYHTSGLRDWVGTLAISGWRAGDAMTAEHIIQMAAHQKTLVSAPGARYDYCNTGWNLLGVVIERVTGQTLREYMDEVLFRPLGMTNSRINDNQLEVIPNKADAYRGSGRNPRRVVDNLEGVGSSSVRTTGADLAKWFINLGTHELGGEELFDTLMTRSVLNDGTVHFKAMGFDVGTYRDRPALTHAGIWAGFRNQMLLFPEDDLYVAILSNWDPLRSPCMVRQVADIYLEGFGIVEPPEEEEETEAEEEAEEFTDEIPTSVLDEYVGVFRLSRSRYMWVSREDNTLMVRETGKDPIALEATAEARFWSEDSRQNFRFERNEEGEVHRLVVWVTNDNPCTAVANTQLSIDRPQPRVQNPPASNRRAYIPPPTVEELEEYAGAYWSDELVTFYDIAVEDGRLVMHHKRHGRLPLDHAYQDDFRGNTAFNRSVRFRRDESGTITGLIIDLGARTRDIVFQKSTSVALPPLIPEIRG